MTTRNRNQNRKQQREVKGPDLIAWCVTERGERSFWTPALFCCRRRRHEDQEAGA